MTLKFSDLIGLGKEGCLRPKRKFLVLGFRSSTCIVGKFACDRHTLVRRVALGKITDPSSHVTRTRDILLQCITHKYTENTYFLLMWAHAQKYGHFIGSFFFSVTPRYQRCTLSKHGKTWEGKTCQVFPFTRASFLRKRKNRRYGLIFGFRSHFFRNKDCKWKPSTPRL